MTRPTVFIDGEAGTTGLQIAERLHGRDDIELIRIAPEKRRDDAERARLLNQADVAVLCLPDDAARKAVAWITNPRVRVLDASSAHRVHPDWTYGFPEMLPGQADAIRGAARVTNPGCYPTGMIALTRPLVDAGLLPPEYPLVVPAISGYSGGGRSMIESFEGRNDTPITDAVRLYALNLAHKHVLEMRKFGRLAEKPLFTPMVGAFRQGMLVQIPLHLRMLPSPVSGGDLHRALAARYANSRFIRVAPFEPGATTHLEPEALNGTNQMELFVFENEDARQVLLVARLDNLGKGASGAALQNLDLLLGLGEGQTYALR